MFEWLKSKFRRKKNLDKLKKYVVDGKVTGGTIKVCILTENEEKAMKMINKGILTNVCLEDVDFEIMKDIVVETIDN